MKKIVFLLLAIGAVALTITFDLQQYFTLDYIKSQQSTFSSYYAENPVLCLGVFFLVYFLATAFSFPGAAVMTLLAGALFGVVTGTIIVSFASTLGATAAFLMSRWLLKDSVQARFGDRLKAINEGVKKDGAFYLFTLRLLPAVPFFVLNLAMGLTPISVGTYFIVSQIGMIPGTIVYVNAGTQLGQLDSLQGLLSFNLLASFVVLAFFPYIIKGIFAFFKNHRLYKNYKRPKSYQYNMVVIGGGSAGLVTSYIGAATKGKVALIEKHKMGGDCLNTGCVPSKALLRSAKFAAEANKAESLGFTSAKLEFDFANVMERVQRVIKTIEPHDSVERYEGLGVECFQGTAKILSPFEVEVNGQVLTTRNIVIGTGARPFVPPIEGLKDIPYYTSDTIWSLRDKPKRMVVLGGGPIGTELVQAFSRLGVQVTQIERGSQILGQEDEDVAQVVFDRLQKEGVTTLLNHTAQKFYKEDDSFVVECDHNGQIVKVEFDAVLVAVGRVANTTGFGLEELGIKKGARGTLKVDEYLRATYPNIYACGDVIGPYQFTHTAAHEAWFCAVNSMVKPFYGFKADYRVIPWATYTDPEVARVGLNERDAKAQGIDYEVSIYPIDDLDRAIAEEAAYGFVKVLTQPGSDKILGATIVGLHAGDIIAEYVAAMKHGFGMNKILGTIHIYPTLAEANKFAAGVWKKSTVTEGTLKWGERINRWRRDIL